MRDERDDEIEEANQEILVWMSRLTDEWETYDLSELTDLSALGLRLCVWYGFVEIKFPVRTWNQHSKRKVRMTAFVTGEWEILLPDEVQRIVPGWIETTVFVQPNKRQKIRLTQEGLRAKHNPDMTWMGSLEICLFNHTFYQPGKVSLRVLDDVTGTTETAQPIQFNGPVTAQMGDVHVAGSVNFHADVTGVDDSSSDLERAQDAAGIFELLKDVMLEDTAQQILQIANNKKLSADERMCKILELDSRYASWKSKKWAKLLGVESGTIRGASVWKKLQKERGNLD